MNHLLVYPTSRGARERIKTLTPFESLSTTVTTIADFESKSFYVSNKVFIDSNARVLFFKENIDASLFVKSETIFKLFEELAHEKVELEELLLVDSYAQYEEQITELIEIQHRYKEYLDSKGYTDRAFIAKEYEISLGYISNFSSITIYLDGYLTQFEFELFESIAKKVPLFIELEIDQFSMKNIDKFHEFDLKPGYRYRLDMSKKRVCEDEKLSFDIDCSVYHTNLRMEQVFFVFDAINKMIGSGISPQNIAVVLPDENFKYMLKKFDRHNYLNFAMGFDYEQTRIYKTLDAVYKSLNSFEPIDQKRLELFGIEWSAPKGKIEVDLFLAHLQDIAAIDQYEELKEKIFKFSKIYKGMDLEFREYLYLFLKEIKNVRLDDVRGGQVTVLGPLESRSVSFEGVVIVDFNESFVPKINQKDIYLNSQVKSLLKLPTKKDREELQKHLYFNLLAKSKQSFICYCQEESKSKFLYELGFEESEEFLVDPKNFFMVSHLQSKEYEEVEFDSTSFIWSSTMFKTYLDCKRKFYFKYIRSVKERSDDKVNEGAILHKILSECETFSSQEVFAKINLYAPNRFYAKLWQQKLSPFIEMMQSYKGVVVAKEIKRQKNIAGIEFQGVADRIDLLDNGRHLLIDYKSGKIENKSRNLESLTDFQMPIYSLLFSEYDPVLAFLSLFDAKFEYVEQIEKKLEHFYENLANLKSTHSLVAQKCEQPSKCRYCPYTIFCQRGEFS